jgi:hypothetical protein
MFLDLFVVVVVVVVVVVIVLLLQSIPALSRKLY